MDFNLGFKTIKKLIIGGVIALFAVIILCNCFTIINPTERGMKVTLGVVDEDILEPGLVVKAPFVQKIQKYDITPIQYESSFKSISDAAVTSDKQSILVNFELFWKYNIDELYEVATKYKTKEALYQPISTSLKGIIKDLVGKLSINDIISNQGNLTKQIKERLEAETEYLPVSIDKFTITNFDWSDEYDRQIEETAKLAQQVEQMKQEALIVEAEAQKQVKQASAKLEAEKLNAEAVKVKAQAEADAKRLEGEGIAAYNKLIAKNQELEIRLKELEIEKIKAERWDGREVANYIPLTAAGGIVNLNN